MISVVWVLAFVAFIAFLVFKPKGKSESSQRNFESAPVSHSVPSREFTVTVDGIEHDFSQSPLFHEIAPLISRGDWDSARRYLQKVAYGVVNGSDSEKEMFKIFMMGFATADPLYAQCIRAIQPILQASPDGMRQTALYPHMAAAPDAETARYVLYYADLLGAVRRKKKGNSYTVFPGH